MRILQVRFKNLNSLAGEWHIDLTLPAFANEGIFAITGPTGAGKSTILDAICLGLYGRTPRLNKVTKNTNEIMSRQTGDCFAEVTFQTQAGHYRCHWSQHRARKKPDGELQPPKHEMADANSGKIIEAKIRRVADKIENATGMDFDQFTRSMLLAQGGFAAFLQAAADDRAPILEQITGTDIYSQISIRVHERRAAERKQMDTLQAELAGMPLLTPEDEQTLSFDLAQKAAEEKAMQGQITQKTQAIAWLEEIARLEQSLQKLEQQQQDWQNRIAAFAPEQEKLQSANLALELAGEYSTLTAMRQEQARKQHQLSEYQNALPTCEDAEKQAGLAMNAAAEQLAKQKMAQQTALPILRHARELDLRMSEKEAPIKSLAEHIADNTKILQELRGRQHDDSAKLQALCNALADLSRQLQATQADAALVEHLTGLSERFEALRHLHTQYIDKLAQITQANSQWQQATQLWQRQSANRDRQKQQRDTIQEQQQKQQEALHKLLEGKELADWRDSLSALSAQKELLADASEAAHALAKSRQALEELEQRKVTLSAETTILEQQLEGQTEKRVGLEKECSLLETQLTLLQKIEDLEQARQQLQDHLPCPLCGATEHPFAQGNVPLPDATRQSLDQRRLELKAAIDAVSELKIQRARHDKDLEQVVADQQQQAQNREEANRLLALSCEKIPLDASAADLQAKLRDRQAQHQQATEQTAKTVQAAEKAEKAYNTARATWDQTNVLLIDAERTVQDAAHAQDSAKQGLERLQQEAAELQQQQDNTLGLLQQEVKIFGIEIPTLDALATIQQQLTARREQWLTRQQEKTALEQKIATLETKTRQQTERTEQLDGELKKHQQQHASLRHEQDTLRQQRQTLFADNNPDAEETRLAEAVNAEEQNQEAARRNLNAANQALGQLRSTLATLTQAKAADAIQLADINAAFLTRLKDAGFADEDRYQAACLPESERKALAQSARKLADEQTELIAKTREKTTLLESQRQKQMTDEPRHALDTALNLLLGEQKTLQQQIGAIHQKLTDNQSLKQQQQERLQAIAAQERECVRWDSLHELIGSADGKKYRNFAQGLTFDIMIGHANQQLQKMTDRYLLSRDDGEPLELNVIDNYQAGEIRSTKNLSGGEGFIISLALALGLSQMASKNVRVDSLFLDEGFGTLDEEALETALDTLAELRQEGKLIGVISHVPALKERILTQIQVSPQSGGRSKISGPGCRKYPPATA
jgi:exonuclease SbcC